jgi:hypothetical protein
MQIPMTYMPISYNYHGNYGSANQQQEYQGCETCDNRAYMDKSSDSTVSMQTPTKMNPSQAAHMVIAHEMEHIRNDRVDAENRGSDVVSQSVRLHNAICQECGVTYVAGGQATTVTKESVGDLLDEVA